MHAHAYDLVLLFFLLPCVSASRVKGLAREGDDKGRAEELSGLRRHVLQRVLQSTARRSAYARPAALASEPARATAVGETSLGLPAAQDPEMKGVGRECNTSNGYQVFTDIDDTIFCSGGPPAGSDKSCYKKEIYPGVLQFMLEVSRGPNETVHPSKVVPLSHRPAALATVLSLKGKSGVVLEATRTGQTNGLPSWGLDVKNAQYGKLLDSMLPKRRGVGTDRTKFQRWKKFCTAKPTVFVGDNGQGDQAAAEQMALQGDNRLHAAFIHVVQRDQTKVPASDKIHFFDTYYDAAQIAFDLGLISQAGMERVKQAFGNSSIIQMCNNLHMFTDGRYPCTNQTTGALVDATTLEPLPTGLTLDIRDGTAHIPECSSSKPPSIVRSKRSRCSSWVS